MGHEANDPGQNLERFRGYLALLARLHLDPRLQGKVDLSGVVQQTLLEACKELDRLQKWNESQRVAWLRKALTHNLADEARKLRTEGRNIGREQSLQEAALGHSSACLDACLAAADSSPSERAIRHEELLRLAHALAQLPEDQARAVELHH